MSPRLLPFIGLIALLFGFVDPAAARPRRAAKRSFDTASVVSSKPAAASQRLQQMVYPVADLIVSISSRTSLDVEPLPRSASNAKCSFEECGLSPLLTAQMPRKMPLGATLERQLIELVANTVAPATWKEAGGPGSMQYYPLGMSLVVTQTPEVLEEVAALLAALRRLQDVEAAVETRIVTITPAAFEKACKQLNITPATERDNAAVSEERVVGPKGKRWTANLDQCQVRELLNLVQADPSTSVMQAPKITMFSGQITALEVSQERCYLTALSLNVDIDANPWFTPKQTRFTTGLRLGLRSDVAADRRSTGVQIKGYWCQPAGPVQRHVAELAFPVQNDEGKEEKARLGMVLQKPTFSQVRLDEDFTLPDGTTALVSCGVVPVEVVREDLCAYWHCLWTGERLTTSADRHVFFLVTSRIIVNEEEEEKVVSVPTATTNGDEYEVPPTVSTPRESQR